MNRDTNPCYSPLEFKPRNNLANRHSLRRLLRFRLGRLPLHPQPPLQTTQLDPPRVRLRSWSPPLVPDLVGCLRHRVLHALGRRRAHGRRPGIPQRLAVAGRSRRNPGPGLRYDPATDPDPHAHVLHPHRVPSAGIHRHDLRPSLCPQQRRPGPYLARSHLWRERRGERVVLDRPGLPAAHLVSSASFSIYPILCTSNIANTLQCWVPCLLPQRTALQALRHRHYHRSLTI